MRKLPHFRRNSDPNSGFTERVTRQLSKRAHNGCKLSALFERYLVEFKINIQNFLRRPCETMQVEASTPLKFYQAIEFTYTRTDSPHRVLPTMRKDSCVSLKQIVNRIEEKRQG